MAFNWCDCSDPNCTLSHEFNRITGRPQTFKGTPIKQTLIESEARDRARTVLTGLSYKAILQFLKEYDGGAGEKGAER